MKTKKVLFYLLVGILGGCVPVLSLHPLYDDQHIVFEEKLLGTFTDGNDTTWEFTRSAEPNVYQLILSSVPEEKEPNVVKGLFTAHLVKLNDWLFLDIFPKEAPWRDDKGTEQIKWAYNTFFYIPVHTFIKIETIEPQLKIRLTDDDNFKKLLKEDPNAVRNEPVEGKPVLTASTQQLKSFVLKYANDSRLFSDEHILTRKILEPSRDVNEPKKSEPNINDIPTETNEAPV